MSRRFAALLLAAAAISAAPAVAGPLDGTYDTDCANEFSEMRVSITGDLIVFYESACHLTNPVSIRDIDGATLFDTACEGEGETWTGRILLMPRRDGGLVRVFSGYAVEYDSCD